MSDTFQYRCEDCGAVTVSRIGDTFRLASAGTWAGLGKFRVACPDDPEHRGVVMEEARVVGADVHIGVSREVG